MAIYAISDLHGCKDEFDQMLEKIRFSEYDDMWIIGDVCDRGRHSIALLQEIMSHSNMHLIFGNHDLWLSRYAQALIDAKKGTAPYPESIDFQTWIYYNGGNLTADEFMDLPIQQCYDIKLYLENKVLFQRLDYGGKHYLMVHAGLEEHCRKNTVMESVPELELLWSHIGIDDNPFPDTAMIVGHTPTFLYGNQYENHILLSEHGMIHIDCGCVYGRTLGCIRLNDMQEFYVPSTYKYLKV